MIELQIATVISFIVSLFVLYRLLVSKYEQQVKLLMLEIGHKHNYKEKLEEFKLFYQEELKIIKSKLESATGEKGELENQVEKINRTIEEIQSELNREVVTKERISAIAQRQEAYLMNNMENLKEECQRLQGQKEEQLRIYRNLVEHVKGKYGVDALLDFHYDNQPIEKIKHRRRHSIEQKYKNKA